MIFPTRNSIQPRPEPARRGFTLIEALLVVVIAALAAAVAIPRFVKSFEGAQLRAATRAIVMAHRYARGAAAIHQQYAALVIGAGGDLLVLAYPRRGGAAERDAFLEGRAAAAAAADGAATETNAPAAAWRVLLEREAEEAVRLDEVDAPNAQRDRAGNFWIEYAPNGQCAPFTARLSDRRGRRTTIKVDGISGRAETTDE